jgi:polyisoprenoid-binding protein YceI
MSATTIATTPLAGTWTVDPTHSNVEFSVKHLGIATVKGAFREFEGTLVVGEDLASATAAGTVKVASVDTNEPQRDDHLRSPDFFDAANHPELTFTSTAIRPVDEDTFEIDAQLTMHGVTNPITLTAEVQGYEQDPWGNRRVGLEITGQLKRGDYGMTFNQALGSGNLLVGDRVAMLLDISAVLQPA